MKGLAVVRGSAQRAVILAVLLPVFLHCFMSWQDHRSTWQVQEDEPVVRLHVRAAGDSPEEQRFKMALVTQVQQRLLEKALSVNTDYSAYVESLQVSLPGLREELQNFAAESGEGAAIAVELLRENFPLRTYGRRIYPAGYYTALVVTVGEGGGENWWCLLFPPLCLPPMMEGEDRGTPDADPAAPAVESPSAGSSAPDEEEDGAGAVRWRSAIWELICQRGQYIVEKAADIFYN